MSKEILDAVTVLEREKGISADRLMEALEDALLSAYKKSPGSAKLESDVALLKWMVGFNIGLTLLVVGLVLRIGGLR